MSLTFEAPHNYMRAVSIIGSGSSTVSIMIQNKIILALEEKDKDRLELAIRGVTFHFRLESQ